MLRFSFSKLEKYIKCSWWYFLYYFDKSVPRPNTNTSATMAGNFIHSTMEDYYGPTINRAMHPTDILDIVWMNHLTELGIFHVLEELRLIAMDVANLAVRAGKDYKGVDAIRDKDGKPFKAPQRSGAWEKAAKALGLPTRRAAIDGLAKSASLVLINQEPDKYKREQLEGRYPWQHVSISEVFAMTFEFLDGFKDSIVPAGLTVLGMEVPLSMPATKGASLSESINMVHFPNGNIYGGYIDMIATDSMGRLYIIDHKTSKDAPSPAKVGHWEQLIMYAWAHYMVWGRYPDFIAIHSVRNSQLVIAPFNPSLIEATLRRKMGVQEGIAKQVFIQQDPTGYGSQCHNDYTGSCEYLKHCHPSFAQQVMHGTKWAQ